MRSRGRVLLLKTCKEIAMTRLTNQSPEALTMRQAVERARKISAQRFRQIRQARVLAAQGRGEDTEIAHVALGELVVPRALQSPELLDALERAAVAHDIPLETLSIGNVMNRINPNTGAPEFGILGDAGSRLSNSISGQFGARNSQKETAQNSTPSHEPPAPGIGTMQIPVAPNDRQIDSGIVTPPYSAPTRQMNRPSHDPRLIGARERDLEIPEVNAFLDAVSKSEGAGFHTVLGTNQFPMGRLTPDLTQFPNRGPDNRKTASGAYQIQEDVYDDLSGQMGLRGFDPQTQRLMAAQLLQRANGGKPGTESALEALRRGDYNKAAEPSRPTWTSLPGAKEQNKYITPDQLRSYYEERLKLYRSQRR